MKQPVKLASVEQILDIQYQISLGLRKMPGAKAKLLLKNKKALQQFIAKIYEELEIPMQNEQALAAIPLLIDYYQKVYGIDISEIAEMQFPEHAILRTFMAVSPKHNEDEIMEAQKKYFHKKVGIVKATDEDSHVGIYQYKNPVVGNINRDEEKRIQPRPSGLYLFAHSNEDEPDAKYRGKSYDDAVEAKIQFANAKEYLLITGFHKFTKGYFMDKKGWTRTSSLWSDGSLVSGGWDADNSELYLNFGYTVSQLPSNGPRKIYL